MASTRAEWPRMASNGLEWVSNGLEWVSNGLEWVSNGLKSVVIRMIVRYTSIFTEIWPRFGINLDLESTKREHWNTVRMDLKIDLRNDLSSTSRLTSVRPFRPDRPVIVNSSFSYSCFIGVSVRLTCTGRTGRTGRTDGSTVRHRIDIGIW